MVHETEVAQVPQNNMIVENTNGSIPATTYYNQYNIDYTNKVMNNNPDSVNKQFTIAPPINYNRLRCCPTNCKFDINKALNKIKSITAIASEAEKSYEEYGRDVVIKLFLLPKKQALEAQSKINHILTEELMKYKHYVHIAHRQYLHTTQNNEQQAYVEDINPLYTNSTYLMPSTSSTFETYNIPPENPMYPFEVLRTHINDDYIPGPSISYV